MATQLKDLRKLKPIQFPRSGGTGSFAYKITGSPGKPTKQVIAEIKRLSKKGIYQVD